MLTSKKNFGKCIITIEKNKLEQVKQVKYFSVTGIVNKNLN